MGVIYPAKLRPGDLVRVIAPSLSRSVVTEHDHTALIDRRFADLGLRLSYGRHVDERDEFNFSGIAERVADLHAAFSDDAVKAVLTVVGGHNSNELLPFLDWDLIAAHPKVFCGYSDISALQNAILARTGLVTYSGPHWSSFGMRDHFEQTLTWFTQALFADTVIDVAPAASWTDDAGFADQDDRHPQANDGPDGGWWPLAPGEAEGRVVGGNLCTLNLLQGTPNMPSLDGALLMIEDDFESSAATFARDRTSLLQLPDAGGIHGLVIGRFQGASQVSRELLGHIVGRQPRLAGRPVLANVNFGHTSPQLTLPIGGRVTLEVGPPAEPRNRLRITSH